FFQAEDGIRDRNVTGVQTCALPILPGEFHGGELSARIPVEFLSGIRPATRLRPFQPIVRPVVRALAQTSGDGHGRLRGAAVDSLWRDAEEPAPLGGLRLDAHDRGHLFHGDYPACL